MKAGIVGLPTTGKTTLFNALTRGEAPVAEFGGKRSEANIGTISVPDVRFDNLVKVYHPKKVSPASIEVIDGAAPIGVEPHQGKFGTDFFTGIRAVEALIHVVRAFESSVIPAPEGGLDPLRDVRNVNDELMLADLQLVETRLDRIEKGLKGKKVVSGTPQSFERDVMIKIKDHLDEMKPLKELDLSPDESRLIRSFDFLTLKPMMIVANIDEDGANESLLAGLREYCAEENLELIELVANIEMEISQLPDEEQIEYLSAMGIDRPARDRVVQSAYRALGVLSFFTAGEDEVKAWTIDKGDRAVDAAGKIHSDLARGFIRAEIVSYEDFMKAGSFEAAKSAGLMRLEGKDYIMHDGDVMVVRFKV
ncbi:MAG: redox-regulated ATPase YchF [Armatimonadota bacterium]